MPRPLTIELIRPSKNLQVLSQQVPVIVLKAIVDVGNRILVQRIKEEIKRKDIVFTGKWLDSQKIEGSIVGGEVVVGLGSRNVPYGSRLELGGPPYRTSKDKLAKWAMKKFGMNEQKASSVARRMVKSIGEKGTKPHPAILTVWRDQKTNFFSQTVKSIKRQMGT